MNIETITPQEAKRQGYRSLTVPYSLTTELKQFESIVASLTRQGIPHVLCQYPKGVGIWRK